MHKGLITLFMLLGVITLFCWLVATQIFSVFGTLMRSSIIFQGGLMVSVLLPVLLFGFLALMGLVLYVKSRD